MIIDQGGRTLRRTTYTAAPAGLGDVVREGWIQRYVPGDDAFGTWRIAPDLNAHLIVHGGSGGADGLPLLVGARSLHADRRARASGWTVGVALRAGALGSIGAVPADLLDRGTPLEEALGPPGRRLANRLAGVSDPRVALDLLLGFVRAGRERTRHDPDWRIRAFVAYAAESRPPRVRDIARALGVSPRCLRDVWTREVGFPPRRALSVLRFRRAVREALRVGGEWSAVAHAVGYHDQPHLIREFRSLVGETPTAFLARGTATPALRPPEP